VKSAVISIIYDKAFRIDLTDYKEGIGKINNLISVDVGIIQDFACYAHFLWATPYEMCVSITLLFIVLGPAALGGLVVMIVTMLFGLFLGSILEKYQAQMLSNKDKRMTVVNEILNGIRIIKVRVTLCIIVQCSSSSAGLSAVRPCGSLAHSLAYLLTYLLTYVCIHACVTCAFMCIVPRVTYACMNSSYRSCSAGRRASSANCRSPGKRK
jgi:hypothetical protein